VTCYQPPPGLEVSVAAAMESLALRVFHERQNQIVVCTHVGGKLWGVRAVDRSRWEWSELR
jgi:hypothetical protein